MASVAELLADRYELEVRLGSGGMGDVYRARDRLLERPVAVKVPTTTITPASAERFKREARAAARLNHPNVVGVYDWGGGTEPFIVMEFVEGRSLRAELQERGTLPPAEVAAIGAQIADALAHAHHHGVVHRDVKPSNVLLTPGGSVKVTDFGIAQSAAGEALTEPGVVLGTVGYLSPEQVAGLPGRRPQRRLLARRRPHRAAHRRAARRAASPRRPPSSSAIIARARAADPSERHQRRGRAPRRAARGRSPAPALTPATVPPPRTGAPITAVSVTRRHRRRQHGTARATGVGATSVLPVAAAAGAAAAAAAAVTPPTRTAEPGGQAPPVPPGEDRLPEGGQGAEAGQAAEAAEAQAARTQAAGPRPAAGAPAGAPRRPRGRAPGRPGTGRSSSPRRSS